MPGDGATCSLCQSRALRLIHDQPDCRYFPRRIYRCRRCGYAFVHPMPTPEQLDRVYSDPGYLADRLSKDETSRINRGQLERAGSRLHWLGRYFSGGSILDIGCGNGEFILKAMEKGFEIAGLEASAAAAQAAAGLTGSTIHTNDPRGLAKSGLRFDLVTAWDVIEHVPDPGQFVRSCKELMHGHGLIALSTPNQKNYHGLVYGDRWKGYRDGAEHLHFFNKKTLGLLMRQNGFTTIAARTRRISPVLLRWLVPLGYGNELEMIFKLTT